MDLAKAYQRAVLAVTETKLELYPSGAIHLQRPDEIYRVSSGYLLGMID